MALKDADDIGRRREALSPAKQALLARRLQEQAPAGQIAAAGGSSGALALAQQRFWFFHQWAPEVPLYHSWVALRLRGPLSVPGLEHSLNQIVARHEPLRTVFPAMDGEPVQRVCPATEMALPVEDVSGLDAARERMEALVRQPFDLAAKAPVRVRLYRLAPDDHVLLFVTHHIVFDGWSANVLVDELCALYSEYVGGRPAALPELPVRYLDFAGWQRAQVGQSAVQESLSYWKERLGGELPVLDLPADRPRPTERSFRGATERAILPASLAAELTELGRREGATLFMVLLAAFKVLLYRYTGQEDLIVGCPTSGRGELDTERLIGCFINTLALRTDLSGDPTFLELLGRVREVSLGAYAHQAIPLEGIVEALQVRRDANRPPVFQVLFNLENMPRVAARMPGMKLEQLNLDGDLAAFDLSLELTDVGEGLSYLFEYSTDLFDAATIQRMGGHFRRLLEGIVAHPDERIGALPLLTDAERHQMLVEWNDTRMEYPADKCLHHLLEQVAERAPEAGAVVFGERRLTYRQLNERANQLAHHLQELGVGLGSVVGVYLEQSVEMLEGIMGVWKAGAAYVPLDVRHPLERVRFVLQDARARAVLTQGTLSSRLKDCVGTVCLDEDWEQIARCSEANPVTAVTPDDLAYVIYTSGSTGQPKGCLVQHGAAVNHLFGMEQAVFASYPGGSKQGTLNYPLVFDASVAEISCMLTGYCLHIVPEDIRADGRAMLAFLEEHEVDLFDGTPTQLDLMVAAGLLEGGGHRPRVGLISGEATQGRLWRGLAGASHTTFYNTYGPTECAVSATVCCVTPGLVANVIGRPQGNRHAYILDRNLQPVPIGVDGEICLGGAGVGLGYLRRPVLTAERFVPDPFGGEAGARMYKTGDLGRYLPDGSIQFLGRLDQQRQVKMRGHRIELGEIEAVLSSHAAVEHAVVLLREDRPGDPYLAAYIVPVQGQRFAASELRSFLRAKLPDYMVPAAFVALEALPMTAVGKLDWRSLPPPDWTRDEAEGTFVAPRTSVERRLVEILANVLGRERVGVHDDFFELGGHSLLAMRLFVQIEQAFGAKLPVSTIFRCPTVEQLAAAIRQDGAGADWPTLVTIQTGRRRPPFFCVPNLEGTVLAYADLARLLGPDQPVYGFQAKGLNGTDAPYGCLEDMAAHYIKAMQAVQPTGPYYLGGYCSAGVVAFEMARQLDMQGEQVALLAVLDGAAPIGSEQLPRLWQPAAAMSFVRNLPAWLRDNLPGRYDAVLKRVGLRARAALATRWRRLAYGSDAPQARVTLDEFLGNTSRIPERYRRVMNAHFRARQEYVPQVYRGRVTLFRAQALPLLRPSDPELGWGQLAAGGVEVKVIAGAHHNFLEGPQVEDLAAQLTVSLEQASSATHRDRGPSPPSRTGRVH